MRQSDHGDLGHRRMQREERLNLCWQHVLAAGDDHVVDTAGNEDIAVAVGIADIAGEIPSRV